jgi:hypothetical protein
MPVPEIGSLAFGVLDAPVHTKDVELDTLHDAVASVPANVAAEAASKAPLVKHTPF